MILIVSGRSTESATVATAVGVTLGVLIIIAVIIIVLLLLYKKGSDSIQYFSNK